MEGIWVMSDNKIYIEIIGEDAQECAQDLSQIIETELGAHPEAFDPNSHLKHESDRTKFDPGLVGAIAGTIGVGLALPGAVLAAVQIKDRMDKKRKFERLIEKSAKLKKIKRISKIRLRIGSMECEIEKASYAEISEILS